MDTPEAATRRFLSAWQRRNWRAMHRAVQVRRRLANRATPGSLETLFGDKDLRRWAIGPIEPLGLTPAVMHTDEGVTGVTPEVMVVKVNAWYRIGGEAGLRPRVLTINVIREGPDGQPAAPEARAEWGVNEVSVLREAGL